MMNGMKNLVKERVTFWPFFFCFFFFSLFFLLGGGEPAYSVLTDY